MDTLEEEQKVLSADGVSLKFMNVNFVCAKIVLKKIDFYAGWLRS